MNSVLNAVVEIHKEERVKQSQLGSEAEKGQRR